MHRTDDSVTIVWRQPGTPEPNRLTVSRRAVLGLAGLLLLSCLAAVVLAATAVRLHREIAGAHARAGFLEAERGALLERLEGLEAEVAAAREGLERVRSEEAKIRAWLGLDSRGADEGAEVEVDGGKGSLGEVDLEAVAPADRTAEADPPEMPEDGGIGNAAWALATDLADLALRVQERRRYWDAIPAIAPVAGEHWISSAFGWRRSPFTGKREFHSGIDMAGQRGLPVVATADGRVARVIRDAGLGRAVVLDHGNGVETIYGHLDKTVVKKGQKVARGDQVGTLGSSGRRSTGPHLHYAVKVDDHYVNPMNYLLDTALLPYTAARK